MGCIIYFGSHDHKNGEFLCFNSVFLKKPLYDDDDNMVKSVIGGVTTYYVGGIYELIVEGTNETEPVICW